MEVTNSLAADVHVPELTESKANGSEMEKLQNQVDEMFVKVFDDQLEQSLNDVEQLYSSANGKQQSTNTPKSISVLKVSVLKDKDKEKQVSSFKSFKRRQPKECKN